MDYNQILSEFKAGTAAAPPTAAANTIDYDSLLSEFKAGQTSTLESLGKRALGALPLGSDFSEGYNRAVERGTTRMGDAFKDMGARGIGPSNVGSAALGALEYAASPFEGAGTFIGNPIRRVGEGIPGAETVAATADLAPLMFAPFPGAKAMQGVAAAGGAMMGEAPAAMAALQNTMPWLAKMLGRLPETPPPAPVEPPLRPSELPPGTPSMTSGVPARRDWLDQTARGGPAPLTPGQEFVAPNVKIGKGPEVQRAGKSDLDPTRDFSTIDPGDPRRTSAMPTQPPGPQAPVEWFQQQTSRLGNTMEGPYGGDPSIPMNAARQVPVGPPRDLTHPANLEYMRLPNVRANNEVDPQLEAALMERMGFTKAEQAGVSPVRNLELDPQNPGLDPWYSDTPYPNATPMPGSMNAPSPFRNPGRDRNINANPPPTGPEGWGSGGVPRTPGSGGWGGGGPNPRPEDRPPPNPSGGWGGGPVTPNPNPAGGTPPSSNVQERLRQFRGGSVAPNEVPPLKQPETNAPTRPTLPPPTKPMAAAPTANVSAFKSGDTVDIVHKIGGKEMRMPGGTVVEITTRKEPVFERKLRTEGGDMPQRINYEDRQYAKLDDGREVPVTLLQRQGPSLTEKPIAKTPWGEAPAAETKPAAAAKPTGKSSFTEPPAATDEQVEAMADRHFDDIHPDLRPVIEDMMAAVEKFQQSIPKPTPKPTKEISPELKKLRENFARAHAAYGKDSSSVKNQAAIRDAQKAIDDYQASQRPLIPETRINKKTSKAIISDINEGTVKEPEDLGQVIKGIRQALKFGDKSRVPFSYIKNYLPVGTSKSAFNRAVAEMQKTDKALVKMTDTSSKDQYLTHRKLTPDEKAAEATAAKTKQFDKGFSKLRTKFKAKTTYLRNFDAVSFGKVDTEIKNNTIASKLNQLIKDGKVRVTAESNGKTVDKVGVNMFDPEEVDEDYLITFLDD